jgi:pyruvate/2-oxoglutarate dehydrogenase complex dihydrolipoamide dehydrogenase (E3) component
MKYDFDIAIIGGGAGGLFAASVANSLGAKTCIVEKKRLGGDCTWFGCMPSKALLKSAQIANLVRRTSQFGIQMQANLDTTKVMTHVREVVEEIATHHPPEVLEKRGIKVIFGSPQFLDKNTLEVKEKKITAKRCIISTGSHPVVPPIEGLKNIDCLTNENIFDLDSLPDSLIVLGGGPIGVELSQALNRLGVRIYLVEMLERLLFREDREVAAVLEKKLLKEGVNIFTGKKAVKFEKKEGIVYATLEDKRGNREEISGENVLVAVGRAPNLEGLSLEKAGVEFSKTGIKVNSYLQTTNKDIFACGDIVGPYMFSHIAAYQAYVCVRNALLKRIAWQKVNYQNIAWATFTAPQLAHLGLTEEEAREKQKNVKIYKMPYTGSDRAITDLEKDGMVKVITDKKGHILGAHIVGAEAAELMQGLLIAKALRIPLSKIAQVLFIYPTLSELIKKTAAQPLVERVGSPLVRFIIKLMRRK